MPYGTMWQQHPLQQIVGWKAEGTQHNSQNWLGDFLSLDYDITMFKMNINSVWPACTFR